MGNNIFELGKRRNKQTMTPEERLNHLKDFMVEWIDWYASSLIGTMQIMEFYDETGIILFSSRGKKSMPKFKEYLQIIDNQK